MSRLLPDWLEAYMVYTAESESPEVYHKWTAISVIAGALQRRVWFDMGYFSVYPNEYIVLIGPSGAKKSTAMNAGKRLLAQVPGISLSVDSTTRERLILDLSMANQDGHSSMTAFSSEFGSFVTNSSMDMILFLTDIYESPIDWTHRTKSGGTNKIVAPCLNLVACTTPDWLGKALPLDTVGIGLTSRILFVYAAEPRVRDPFPRLSEEQRQLADLLVSDLGEIATLNGEFVLESDAKEFYTEWYKRRSSQRFRLGDSRLNGYFERKPMHILKLAMIVSASYKNDLVITQLDIERGMSLIEEIERTMPQVFQHVGKNPLAFDIEQVLATVLEADEGVTFNTLLTMFKHSVRMEELAEVMMVLEMTGAIRRETAPDGTKTYYPLH